MAISYARGGDGWSRWTTQRRGDDVHVLVTSSAATMNGEPVVLLDTTMSDGNGRTAVAAAEKVSAEYAHRMAN